MGSISDAGRILGTLTDWNARKACGFIEVLNPAGKKYFAHKSEFEIPFQDGQGPPPGTTLSFVPGVDPKSGKERACQIRPETGWAVGTTPQMQMLPQNVGFEQPRLYGVLIQWQPEKACGFIDCADPAGKRIFAHKSEFEQQFVDGMGPPLGTPLSFVLGQDPKSGKERACQIRAERQGNNFGCGGAAIVGGMPVVGGGMYQQAGFTQPVAQMYHMQMAPAPVVGFAQPQLAPAFGGRMQGVLCEWHDEKACGFIEVADHGGKKLFAHKSDFALPFEDGMGPAVGSPLNFSLGSDPKSGKQRARDIRLGGLGMAGAAAGAPRMFGSLTEWSIAKACGFIQCFDPAGKKLFAHKSEFAVPFGDGEEPPVGTTMSFVHGFDAKSGRERAQDIRLEDRDSLRLYGMLCEWRDEKACGFIEVANVDGTPGKRYFAHKSEFAETFADGQAPPVGTEMSFMPGVDAKSGKERATDIRLELAGVKRRSTIGVVPNAPSWKRVKVGGAV